MSGFRTPYGCDFCKWSSASATQQAHRRLSARVSVIIQGFRYQAIGQTRLGGCGPGKLSYSTHAVCRRLDAPGWAPWAEPGRRKLSLRRLKEPESVTRSWHDLRPNQAARCRAKGEAWERRITAQIGEGRAHWSHFWRQLLLLLLRPPV